MIRLSRFSLDHPRSVLIACIAITLAFAAGITRLEIRTDGDALLPHGDPVIMQDVRDRTLFRDPRTLLLLVESRDGGPLLETPAGFRFLDALQTRLVREDVLQPSGLLSLAGLNRIVERDHRLAVERHLSQVPEDDDQFAALVDEIRAHPLSDGLLLSADGRRSLLALAVNESVDVTAAVAAMEQFCHEFETNAFALTIAGPLAAETTLGDKVLRDLAVLVPLMLVTIVVLLYAMLRSAGGVMVPMIETGTVLLWTFGAMGWWGAPVALVTTVLPVVLMAMCITDEIHLLERLLAHWRAPTMRGRIDAALGDVARPIILTSLTTALGFLSFASASIQPMRQFGFFAAFGILVAMALSFSLIPAILVLMPDGFMAPRGAPAGSRSSTAFGRIAASHPGRCFVVGVLALAVVAPGWARLRVGDSWVDNFDPDSPLVRSEHAINQSFWGSYRFDVVLESAPGFFMSPSGVALAERVRDAVGVAPYSGGAETYLMTLERLADFLDPEGPFLLSDRPREELQDLFTLAEMSQNRSELGRLITPDGSHSRTRIYMKSADYEKSRSLSRYLDDSLGDVVGRAGANVHFSGDVPVASALVESIVHNQLRSIAWAIATIALLLLLFERRASALWAMVPVLAATAGLFGAMGLLGIELGIATSMFASLSVGVGVDFGIHFLHRFEREREAGHRHPVAIRHTIERAGRALFWNAIVLGVGFSVLSASSLKPNHRLGGLLAASTIACYASCFLLLPYLLKSTIRKYDRRAETSPSRSRVSSLIVMAALSGGIGIAVGCSATSASAGAPDCEGAPDPEATKLMKTVEAIHRSTYRLQRLHIDTLYPEGSRITASLSSPPAPKTLWGVVRGDPTDTWLIFVFTGPGRMAGTTLLIHDPAGPDNEDAIWFYLRAFEHFERIDGSVEKAVVPGTALTYEDARGYIATDRYRFLGREGAPQGLVRVLACPRTPQVAEHLGYSALEIDVDPKRHLVDRVQYYRLGGGPLKRYQLVESVMLGEHHFPAAAKLEHSAGGFDNDIFYEYWVPNAGDADSLFEPSMEEETFLSRMRTFLVANGLEDRIDAEIVESDARIREYDRKMEEWNRENLERRREARRKREAERKAQREKKAAEKRDVDTP